MKKNSIALLINFVLGQVLYPIIIMIIAGLFVGLKAMGDPSIIATITVYSQVITAIIVFGLSFRKIKEGWAHFKERIVWNSLFILLMVAVTFVISFVGSIILSLVGVTGAENQEIITQLFSDKPILLVILTVMCAPLIEEATFRFAIKELWPKRFVKPLGYILFSGILFGSMHVIASMFGGNLLDLLNIIIYAGIGCVLSYSYVKSNENIVVVWLIHLIYNGLGTCLILLVK